MKKSILSLLICGMAAFGAQANAAQSLEEVIVTGALRTQKDMPGTFLRRSGDNLLLAVTVSNDTREEGGRKNEIYETLKNAIDAAAKQQGLHLSIVDQHGNVLQLTRDNYLIDLAKGARPDTSVATIRLKKQIPNNLADPDRLLADLLKFVKQVPLVGRTRMDAASGVEVSIVDPNQYRDQIVQKFTDDTAQVLKALGPDYRLLVEGIDAPVKFARIGISDVALYIPYRYRIVPTSINAILEN